jgi:hypothetical protein
MRGIFTLSMNVGGKCIYIVWVIRGMLVYFIENICRAEYNLMYTEICGMKV